MNHPRIGRTGRLCPLGLVLIVAPVLTGCGERPRYPISGKVTYNGKPVPAGTIVFVPDYANGNSGSTTVAEIKNGKYATESDAGVHGGPYLVRVNGTDGVAATVGEGGIDERGRPIFPQFEKKVDLTAQDHVLDIEVPATSGVRQGGRQPEGQG